MKVNFRLPNINGKTEAEQIAQLKSYLFQLVRELEWVFESVQVDEQSKNDQLGNR